jgi:hypothetical protein
VCDEKLKKGKQVACMFCKYYACEKDCRKTRRFPEADEDDLNARGACCKICDKKFIIKELSIKWSDSIHVVNEGIQNRLNQLTEQE